MKRFTKTTVTLAIAAASFSSQFASAEFLEDSTLRGKLRTTYYNIEKSDRVDTNDSAHPKQKSSYAGAWTGSVAIDAKSGYWQDAIGLDASIYGVSKFYMPEHNGTNSKELLNQDGEGFGKIGQAFVKLKFGNEEANGQLNAGRQIIYNALISSSTSRSVPSSWRGLNFNGYSHGIHIGAAYVDQMSLRSESGFHKLENFDGKRIDYIAGAQIDTTINNLELIYRNAFSKDFLQAHNLKVGYTFDLADEISLTLDTRYYTTKKDGNLWTGYTNWKEPVTNNNYPKTDATFDNKAETISLNAELAINEWTLLGSVGHTRAKSKDGLGHYYYDFGKNTHGFFDSPISAFSEDFMYHNETTWKAGFLYDFSRIGAEGLNAGYAFHYGSGMKASNGQKVDENEHNLCLIYTLPQPSLKGLKFKMTYALYQNDNELRDTIGFGKKNDLRTWVDYQLVAF